MSHRSVVLLTIVVLAVLAGGIFAWRAGTATSSKPKAPTPEVAAVQPAPVNPPGAATSGPPSPALSSSAAPAAALPPGPPLVATTPGRPGAQPVPAPPSPLRNAPPPLSIPADFLDRIVSGNSVQFQLPGGGLATGSVELIEHDGHGVTTVQGRLTAPQPGFYFFHRQSEPGVAGAFSGHVRFDEGVVAYRLEPAGPGGSTQLVPRRIDEVLCVGLPQPPEPAAAAGQAAAGASAERPLNAPQTHPTDIPIPSSQNGIIPLESLPGAAAVVFLDFEGGPGPWPGWGSFPVEPANASNAQIKDVWQRVSEDFQPFNINVTTDRRVFEATARSSRQRVMVTPTNTASPGNGGVAFYNSFNSTADSVCWAFYTTGKNAAEVISHEVGHTLGLHHDGRAVPGEARQEYYGGHGSGDTGWAPIMGVGYSQTLSQWSKGEYDHATQTQDDLAQITNNNNSVNYRGDDYGATHAAAGYLEIQPNNTVSNEGIIERNTDVDAFRFETTGGVVSFTVTRVSEGPNLDIQASIHDAAGTQITSANPTESLNATVSANLAAGEYTLRVTGVGKGNPTSGYSAYGSLGAYIITGSAPGGVKPDRFNVPENAANGTSVGTVSPRKNYGGATLSYSIASGNAGGAFAIHPTTGQLTVANSSVLDHERLSTRWDSPATIPLFVSIKNSADPSIQETVRVVVTVTDVNEAPVVEAASSTVFSRTVAGTEVVRMSGTDPDRFDFITWSIVGGNTGNLFAINPASGAITIATPPNVTSPTTFQLVVRAMDQLSPSRIVQTTVPITVLPLGGDYQPGTVVRTFYEGISGNAISDLTSTTAKFPNNPESQTVHTSFDGDPDRGENFGSTMTGYLIPPFTGNYTFWIASDDHSELWISPNTTPGSAIVQARVNGSTDRYQYNRFSSQQSASIPLVAGQAYYIEARHKEGVGGDHLTVAWQGPGFSRQVIPGRYLAPYSINFPPRIPATTMQVRTDAINGFTVGAVPVDDVNAQDTHSFTLVSGSGSAAFGIEASTGRIFVKDPSALTTGSSYSLVVRATDSGSPARTGAGTITIQATDSQTIQVSGIVRQIWRNYTGANLSGLTSHPGYPNSPSETRILSSFDAGSLGFSQYVSRIRAYVVPPVTGSYRFYISSDDQSELLLSPNATPVARVNNWVDPRSWTAQSNQASPARTLVAGQRYYIEVRYRQGGGGDDLAVAWTTPTNQTPTVIPGSALEPFNLNATPTWNGTAPTFRIPAGTAGGAEVGSVTATDPEGRRITYGISSGNADGAFAIHPQTGAITVANAAAIASPRSFTVAVVAQDEGLDGVYPLGSTVRTITIEALGAVDLWRVEKFGSDYQNAAISGDRADPDGDGFDNLTEYALGLEPRTADRADIVSDTSTVDGKQHLRLTVGRDPAATDVLLTVESTGNPGDASSWSVSSTTVEIDTPNTLRVRDNTPMDAANARFLRMKATRR